MIRPSPQQVRLFGLIAVMGLLVWAAGTDSAVSILVAFTVLVTVGLFLVPKFALAVIGVFLIAQQFFVNLAGGADTPLGLALHRLHQAFAVAAVLRVVFFLGWHRAAVRFRPWLALTGCFLAAGLGSALIQHVPLTTMALGAFLAVKFQVFLLLALTIPWNERDCARIMRVALWFGPLLLVSGILMPFLPQEIENLFIDRTVESSLQRGELKSLHGIFTHPGLFGWAMAVAGCYAVAALLTAEKRWRASAGLGLTASLFGILASVRRKPLVALPVAVVYGIMRFGTGRRRWTVLALFALLGLSAGWLVLDRLEAEYRDALLYIDPDAPTAPRLLLYATGFAIANSRFPVGAGFGRFGGYVSTLDYSPLYDEYGLSHIHGLSPESPDYIEDTYWPHIAAETGWLGAAILVAFLLLLLVRSSQAALRLTDPASRAVAFAAALVLVEALVESVAGPVFENALFAYGIAVPLGIALVRAGPRAPVESAPPPQFIDAGPTPIAEG